MQPTRERRLMASRRQRSRPRNVRGTFVEKAMKLSLAHQGIDACPEIHAELSENSVLSLLKLPRFCFRKDPRLEAQVTKHTLSCTLACDAWACFIRFWRGIVGRQRRLRLGHQRCSNFFKEDLEEISAVFIGGPGRSHDTSLDVKELGQVVRKITLFAFARHQNKDFFLSRQVLQQPDNERLHRRRDLKPPGIDARHEDDAWSGAARFFHNLNASLLARSDRTVRKEGRKAEGKDRILFQLIQQRRCNVSRLAKLTLASQKQAGIVWIRGCHGGASSSSSMKSMDLVASRHCRWEQVRQALQGNSELTLKQWPEVSGKSLRRIRYRALSSRRDIPDPVGKICSSDMQTAGIQLDFIGSVVDLRKDAPERKKNCLRAQRLQVGSTISCTLISQVIDQRIAQGRLPLGSVDFQDCFTSLLRG
eukprot:m.506401 g.506401  ORF g.506401 m.506401 type:complete len:420 (-) comp57372_c0_seq15:1998-3257(-)